MHTRTVGLPLVAAFAFMLCLGRTLPAGAADGKEPLLWFQLQLPPFFILGDGKLRGYGAALLDRLQRELPDCEHRVRTAPPRRILADARQGKRVVLSGVLKTRERQDFLIYSALPCRLTLNTHIVIRAEDVGKLAPDGAFPVRKALAAHGLTWGCQKCVHHGALQALLDPSLHSPGVLRQSGPNPVRTLLRMLANKRLDWFPADPLGAMFLAEEMDLAEEIAVLPCRETPARPLLGYLACPDTEWGRRAMARMDKVLAREILSGRYFELMIGNLPAALRPEFKRHYEASFLEPARRMVP